MSHLPTVLLVALLSLWTTQTWGQSNVFARSPLSNVLDDIEEQRLWQGLYIEYFGTAFPTIRQKYEAIAIHYDVPWNVLLAITDEMPSENPLATAQLYAKRLAPRLRSGDNFKQAIYSEFGSTALADKIIERTLQIAGRETIMIARSSDGHFYTKLRINGMVIPFLLDTGASEILLTVSDAELARVDISSLEFVPAFRTANGNYPVDVARH